MYKLLVTALLLIGVLPSCSTIIVEPDVVIPNVSYQNDVAPIIAANCAQSGCHGTDNPEKFNLLSYAELSKLVTPDKPHSSTLYDVIRTYEGAKAMPPKPNSPLSDLQIEQIYVWILQGATEN